MNEADAIANNLTNGKIDKSEILHQISTLILKSPNYYDSTIYYRPFGCDFAKKNWAPLIIRELAEIRRNSNLINWRKNEIIPNTIGTSIQ